MIASRLIFLCFALLLATTPMALLQPAQAASFDCAKAAKPLEKLICGNADLSKLDETLAGAYAADLAMYSQEAQIKLRQGQRSWLKYVRARCGYWLGTPNLDVNAAKQCLQDEYQGRLEDFAAVSDEESVPRAGASPYCFYVVRQYDAVPMQSDSAAGSKGELVQHRLAYPQIDAPHTPKTERWNSYVAEQVERDYANPSLEDDLDVVDYNVGFTLGAILPGFISGEFWVNYLVHGAPHPNEFSGSSNYVLATGKSLAPEDIFNTKKPWGLGIAVQAVETLRAESGREIDTDALADLLTDPRYWVISAEALTVHPDFYLMRGGWNGRGTAVISWQKLKPYLRSDLPITLKLD